VIVTSGKSGPPAPAELRAQIAVTRNEMGNTIEEIHGRLNPTILKEQAIDQFREATETVKAELKVHFNDAKAALKQELLEAKATFKEELGEQVDHAKAAVREATIGKVENMVHSASGRVRAAGRTTMDVVRENPIPAALVGIGLAWLFVNSRRDQRRSNLQLREGARRDAYRDDLQNAYPDEYRQDWSDVPSDYRNEPRDSSRDTWRSEAQHGADQVSEITHEAGRKVADTARGAVNRASELAHDANIRIKSGAQRVQQTASEMARGAGDRAHAVQHRFSAYFEENPLVVGIAALAVGTAIGLAIPRTQVEDGWLGKTRDNVVDRAEQFAHEKLQRVGEKAEQVVDRNNGKRGDGGERGGNPPIPG